MQRGEIRQDCDVELGLGLTFGPLYYRFRSSLSGVGPLDRAVVERLVDSLLAGIGTRGQLDERPKPRRDDAADRRREQLGHGRVELRAALDAVGFTL